MTHLVSNRVSWQDELQQLEDRGWMAPYVARIVSDILSARDTSYWDGRVSNAEDYLEKISPDTVRRHPSYPLLTSLLTFGQILDEGGHTTESGVIGSKIQDELLWITNAYDDEENPYPFLTTVGEVQAEHKAVEENIRILDRFLKSTK